MFLLFAITLVALAVAGPLFANTGATVTGIDPGLTSLIGQGGIAAVLVWFFRQFLAQNARVIDKVQTLTERVEALMNHIERETRRFHNPKPQDPED